MCLCRFISKREPSRSQNLNGTLVVYGGQSFLALIWNQEGFCIPEKKLPGWVLSSFLRTNTLLLSGTLFRCLMAYERSSTPEKKDKSTLVVPGSGTGCHRLRQVDQLEKAEVAEEKRSVFRALTRLRGPRVGLRRFASPLLLCKNRAPFRPKTTKHPAETFQKEWDSSKVQGEAKGTPPALCAGSRELQSVAYEKLAVAS